MTTDTANRTIALYPWFKFFQNLLFWQAVWFLYFQEHLSAAQAVLLYAIYDVGTTVLEVPSGYMSDRLGRRLTLILASCAGAAGALLLGWGDTMTVFVAGQLLLGVASAFASGTDSTILFESLEETGRSDEVEAQEVRAWRFSLAALAISAVAGGAVAVWSLRATFLLAAIAMVGALIVAVLLRDAKPAAPQVEAPPAVARLRGLRSELTRPVLVWLFALSVLMYGYSHLPFVFGQPFILQALEQFGLERDAPLVSGIVTATMMCVSVATSWVAPGLRRRLGLARLLLLAFAIQVVLAGALALSGSAVIIALLLLRMVPDSLSKPFITARIQPELDQATRATYLSLQSLAGRLAFAASLALASTLLPAGGAMAHVDISRVLGLYALGGITCLLILAAAARRLALDVRPQAAPVRPD